MFTPEHIKGLRTFLELSPTQFAARLNVSENTVRRWEIGDRHPRWEMMETLNNMAREAGYKIREKQPA